MADIKWTPSLTKALIENVQEYSCLYDDRCPEFKDRDRRNVAQQNIAEKIQHLSSCLITAKAVQKKWSALIQCFRNEQKKIEASKKSGTEGENIYVPTLYWWPMMNQFMVKNAEADASFDNIVKLENGHDMDLFSPESPPSPGPSSKKMKKLSPEDLIAAGLNLIKSTANDPVKEGPYDRFAAYLADSLSNLAKENKHLAERVKRKILRDLLDGEEEADCYQHDSPSQE